MKKIALIFLCITSFSYAKSQSPQALNYQAIARTADGNIMASQNINVRFSILDKNISGTTLYSETHQTTTNAFGLFTLAIGKGTAMKSGFSDINWASGTEKFLKVEIAISESSTYQLQGTTQLLSVPYALYAETTRLIPGNNTIKIINGNTIAVNFQAGSGIKIKGNNISHNLVGGNGISITGNVISSTSGSGISGDLWRTDDNGVFRPSGNVGIRTNNAATTALTISQQNTGGSSAAVDIFSGDTWQTVTRFRNTTVKQEYQFNLAGSNNWDHAAGSFGVFHSTKSMWLWHSNPKNTYLGIGSYSHKQPLPKSRLHVFNGDVNIEDIGKGVIMKSPNGNCWRITVENNGSLVTKAISCRN